MLASPKPRTGLGELGYWRRPPPSRASAWGGWGENSEGLQGYSQGNSCRSTDSTVDGSVVNSAVNGGGVSGGSVSGGSVSGGSVSAGSKVSLQTSPFWD